ncbi:MAG: 4-hydroxybenzoate 3-monooxygenase [Pseudomonadota bacterium]
MRVEVGIIGGGPAGLLLAQLLDLAGISSAILERRSRSHVLSRIRAGVLELGTVDLLHRAGVASRLQAQGQTHRGFHIAAGEAMHRIDLAGLAEAHVTVYGQTEVTRDLYAARDTAEGVILDEAEDVTPHGFDTATPHITFRRQGAPGRIDCAFIVGCDGFHGVSRASIPAAQRQEVERAYPFGWLGVLSETPPVSDELIYAIGAGGFALCSMRSATLSRYYIQVPLGERVEDWPDARFWGALRQNLPSSIGERLVTGASIEKSIAPLRSFVTQPLRHGRLFLAGDAAHIVPPTGAKGLNLAASDIHYLSEALIAFYRTGEETLLAAYSERALARVWKSVRFSWWMTNLLHRFPEDDTFTRRIKEAEMAYLLSSRAAQTVLAENYVGLSY